MADFREMLISGIKSIDIKKTRTEEGLHKVTIRFISNNTNDPFKIDAYSSFGDEFTITQTDEEGE